MFLMVPKSQQWQIQRRVSGGALKQNFVCFRTKFVKKNKKMNKKHTFFGAQGGGAIAPTAPSGSALESQNKITKGKLMLYKHTIMHCIIRLTQNSPKPI